MDKSIPQNLLLCAIEDLEKYKDLLVIAYDESGNPSYAFDRELTSTLINSIQKLNENSKRLF